MKRPRIPRGPGSIKVAPDTTGKPCFICGAEQDVRFVLVQGAPDVEKDLRTREARPEFYLRACAGCMDVIAIEHLATPRT